MSYSRECILWKILLFEYEKISLSEINMENYDFLNC